MPPKAKTPAPIDRPLSKAYLREFGGWSNEYAPEISDSSTLQLMENIEITGEGAAKIRPGLFPLWSARVDFSNAEASAPLASAHTLMSKMEIFYNNQGQRCYLMAVAERAAGGGPVLNVGFVTWNAETGDMGFNRDDDFDGLSDTDHRFSANTKRVTFLQLDNKIVALSDAGEEAIIFWAGAEKRVEKFKTVSSGAGGSMIRVPPTDWVETRRDLGEDPFEYIPPGDPNPYDDPVNDLLSSATATNSYNALTFSTYAHEMGETNPSHLVQTRIARGLSNWDVRPKGNDNYSTVPDTLYARDQLLITMWLQGDDTYVLRVMEVLRGAVRNGATHWNIYGTVWSPQDVAPIEAPLIAEVDLRTPEVMSYTHGVSSAADARAAMASLWGHWTIGSADMNRTHLIPSRGTGPSDTADPDPNYTEPVRASNGLVVGDRLVLVRDRTRPAEIWWTSNLPGRFINLTPTFGGGRKTLTSGNLQVPSAVLLWQNPQSTDTITILNEAEDGASTAYYMAPAQVASQSAATNIMAFEETTATEGTVSPWANEVLNNALYHPLDGGLVKSTANNYNINHKSMTDQISSEWEGLKNKDVIDSCRLGNRLFYLVNNPRGPEFNTELNTGNEVWVLDTGSESGTWSRWLVEGRHLQTMLVHGKLHVVLIRSESPYVFTDEFGVDQFWNVFTIDNPWPEIVREHIDWRLATNTQGANRAHDAWAHLQQLEIQLGNFVGNLKYGIVGFDVHGHAVTIFKDYIADLAYPDGPAWSVSDQLQIKRDMKEWQFVAMSNSRELDENAHWISTETRGQINLIQYRYTPISVNVGYEYGSVETFEYGRDTYGRNPALTVGGVPNNFNGGRWSPNS